MLYSGIQALYIDISTMIQTKFQMSQFCPVAGSLLRSPELMNQNYHFQNLKIEDARAKA